MQLQVFISVKLVSLILVCVQVSELKLSDSFAFQITLYTSLFVAGDRINKHFTTASIAT